MGGGGVKKNPKKSDVFYGRPPTQLEIDHVTQQPKGTCQMTCRGHYKAFTRHLQFTYNLQRIFTKG